MLAKRQARTAPPLKEVFGAAIIFLAAWCCYYPSLSGGFLWDDDRLLTESRIIKSSDGLQRIWCTNEAADFWAATNSLLWTEWRLWGMDPVGYRVTNVITHVAAALLIWAILRRLSIPGAFLAAIIFAVHPVNVESVAWITQQDSTLALLFFLLSILWYLKGMQQATDAFPWRTVETSAAASGVIHPSSFIPHPSSFYWLSLAAFVLAMLGKGSAAVLPVVLLGIAWWQRRLTFKEVRRMLPFFAVAAALTATNIWFQTHGAEVEYRSLGFFDRVLGAGGVIWFYVYKAVLPIDLAFIYPQWAIRADSLLWWLPLLAALAVTAVLWVNREGWGRPFLFAWGFFCVSLLPVMGFTDVEYMECSLVANHYQYIAIIGVIALAAAGWSAWHGRLPGRIGWAGGVVPAMLVLACMVLSWQQNWLFSDPMLVYRASLKTSPRSCIVYNNLGTEARKDGQLDEAAAYFRKAVELNPDYLAARNNLAVVLNSMRQTQDAIDLLQRVLVEKPDYAEALSNLGAALVAAGRPEEAVEYIERAVRAKPDYAKAHYNLGIALSKVGRQSEAVEHFQRAVALKPDYAEAHNSLGVLLGQTGRRGEAIEHFQQALLYDPKMYLAENNLANTLSSAGKGDEAVEHYERALRLKPDYVEARLSLASALVRAKEYQKAIEYYEEALRSKPDSVEACFGLALTYAMTNRRSEAAATAQKAVDLARSQGRTDVAGKIEDWLRSYRAGWSE
jgi:protein O-mannosyl-transferase